MSVLTMDNREEAAWLEEGTAVASQLRRQATGSVAGKTPGTESLPVVVIGGGQSGLSVGYHLKRRGIPFAILEAAPRIGDVWRKRWDSLRLFTPATFDGLDGMPFPTRGGSFPTKDEMGDFLEAYAHRFDLPVRTGQRVTRLSRDGDGFLVETQGLHIRAAQVVVAMANYQRPKLPGFAAELAPDITQIHSFDYRNPAQLKRGQVLVVGAGNSGAEIARELATAGHHVTLSGRKTGEVPFRIDGTFGAPLLRVTLRVLFHRILTTSTPLGRKARPVVVSQGGPLIRTKWKDLTALGVEHAPRAIGTYQGRPLLEGGLSLDVANVVWCTGFHSGFEWIDFPFPTDHGRPAQVRGVVQQLPGFYFTGQHFLYAMSSAMIHGAGRDAHYVVDRIAERITAAKG